MATKIRPAEDESRKADPDFGIPDRAQRRVLLAQVLAFVALVAALIGALGPAKPIGTTYAWPPRLLPPGNPTGLWYTPLMLTHRTPRSLSARIPCRLPPALPRARRPITVLATASHPATTGGLNVTTNGRELSLTIGEHPLDLVPLPAGSSRKRDCAYRLAIADRGWALRGGPKSLAHAGRLEEMPVVNGLLSELDLRTRDRPSIEMRTEAQSVRPVQRQAIAWTLAAICALASLLLVSFESRSRRSSRASVLRRALKAIHPADGVVVLLLVIWWVLSPEYLDDGWVVTTARGFKGSGGFSYYFDAFGGNFPLGYWLQWLQHWLAASTTTLVFLRIPALVCLAATWALCRWTLARIMDAPGRSVPVWVLAAAFAVVSFSWDMTLRPEPVVALLTAGVLACAVEFVGHPRAAPLAIGVLLVALAVTSHPTGIVAVAPLLAAVPAVLRWVRSHVTVAATLVSAAIASLVVLATLGSDLAQRRSDAAAYRAFGTATGWRDELWRYELLSLPPWGTGLRRASVGLIALALVAYLFRSRQTRTASLLTLPIRALAIGLGLLAFVPSKWPLHFGSLLALAAVASAGETARLLREASAPTRSRALPFLWIVGSVVVAAWSWTPRFDWTPLDLRTLDWNLGLESVVPLSAAAVLLPALALLCVSFLPAARGGRLGIPRAARRVAPWTVVLVAVPLLVFTLGVLSADAAKTDSWTLTEQNLGALRREQGCGLADDLVAAVPASMRSLSQFDSRRAEAVPAWIPATPDANVQRFVLGPITSGSVRTPWFVTRGTRSLGVFVAGPSDIDSRLSLEYTRIGRGRTRVITRAPLAATAPEPTAASPATWRFLQLSDNASSNRHVNAVRITLAGNGSVGEAAAVTAPVTFASDPLARTLRDGGSSTLTNPFILPYFPCAQQPRLAGGIVETPSALVSFASTVDPLIGRAGGPFNGLLDLYSLTRIPLVDREGGPFRLATDPSGVPAGLALYEVDMRIPGAKVAPANVVSSG